MRSNYSGRILMNLEWKKNFFLSLSLWSMTQTPLKTGLPCLYKSISEDRPWLSTVIVRDLVPKDVSRWVVPYSTTYLVPGTIVSGNISVSTNWLIYIIHGRDQSNPYIDRPHTLCICAAVVEWLPKEPYHQGVLFSSTYIDIGNTDTYLERQISQQRVIRWDCDEQRATVGSYYWSENVCRVTPAAPHG